MLKKLIESITGILGRNLSLIMSLNRLTRVNLTSLEGLKAPIVIIIYWSGKTMRKHGVHWE
jgi:hypothetical protein